MIKITDFANDQFIADGIIYLCKLDDEANAHETVCKTHLEAYLRASEQALVDSFDSTDIDYDNLTESQRARYETVYRNIANQFESMINLIASIKD